jgi:hypothetical protein
MLFALTGRSQTPATDPATMESFADYNSDANKLPPYSVRVVDIRRREAKPLKAKALAPLTFVAVLGCVLSAMLLGISIHFRDGMSIVATVNLSLLSSLIGYGNKWTLQLPRRFRKISKHKRKAATFNRFPTKAGDTPHVSETVANPEPEKQMPSLPALPNPKADIDFAPKGDVVIRYPKGSFLVVRCSEDIARELYFAPEEIEYLLEHAWAYRLLSLIGTMMLMGGVICLANARIENQIAWAGAYMLLGSSYWIVAALPGKLHWDTTAYEVVQEALSDSDLDAKGYPSLVSETFTQALWRAIVVSKDTSWVRQSNACPSTKTWDDWLDRARTYSQEVRDYETLHNGKKITTWEIPPWDPQECLNKLLEADSKDRISHSMA